MTNLTHRDPPEQDELEDYQCGDKPQRHIAPQFRCCECRQPIAQGEECQFYGSFGCRACVVAYYEKCGATPEQIAQELRERRVCAERLLRPRRPRSARGKPRQFVIRRKRDKAVILSASPLKKAEQFLSILASPDLYEIVERHGAS